MQTEELSVTATDLGLDLRLDHLAIARRFADDPSSRISGNTSARLRSLDRRIAVNL